MGARRSSQRCLPFQGQGKVQRRRQELQRHPESGGDSMKAKLPVAFLALFLGVQRLFASDALGGAAAYLHSGAGARALGMGGASVALVDDVTATVWNPAGLTRMGVYGTQVGSMVSLMSQDRNLNFLALGQHFEGLGDFGLTLQHFSVD